MKGPKEMLLVFTDLDGTLLDDSYEWTEAEPALEAIRRLQWPLILNSSKTVSEMQRLSEALKTDAPLVAENGGVVAVAKDSPLRQHFASREETDSHVLLYPGLSRDFILSKAHALRGEQGFRFSGFADWSVGEVVDRTGLDPADAERAMQRMATEPIVWQDTDERLQSFLDGLDSVGIRAVRGGRFIHLMGNADKADGLRAVTDLYRHEYPGTLLRTVALGDSANDLRMLSAADIAVVIPDARGERLAPEAPCVIQASVAGPAGWNEAMEEILKTEREKTQHG